MYTVPVQVILYFRIVALFAFKCILGCANPSLGVDKQWNQCLPIQIQTMVAQPGDLPQSGQEENSMVSLWHLLLPPRLGK